MIRNLFNFFLFSSLFIALGAVLMVHQTNQLLQLRYDFTPLLYFVFFSTLCSYNIHWYFTPVSFSEKIRSYWTQKHRYIHLILAITGAAGSAWFFFSFGKEWIWIIPAILLTFLYTAPKLPFTVFSHLKKVAIGKTIYLSAVWMYVTAALPLLISGKSWNGRDVLFCISRFFFIYAICILFDYRDREQDKQEGIRSLITYFSEQGINRLFVSSFLLFVVSTTLLLLYNISIPVIITLLVPGLLTALLFRVAKRNDSDYLFYFILDGLMMFSSLLTQFMSF